MHLLPYHSLDVAACGKALLELKPRLLVRLANITETEENALVGWVAFLLSLHDIGKFSNGFQAKRPDILERLGKDVPKGDTGERHDSLGYRLLDKCLPEKLKKLHTAEDVFEDDLRFILDPWACSVAGHHGRPPEPAYNPPPLKRQFPRQVREDTMSFIDEVTGLLLPTGLPFSLKDAENALALSQRASWVTAGIAVTADWIGSKSDWFPYREERLPLEEYWRQASEQAEKAVRESGLCAQQASVFTGILDLFQGINTLTGLQRCAETIQVSSEPQLFIIEEVTGGGKTEAALAIAHRLISAGEAEGVYMALPTMATANAMYRRVEKVYKKLFAERSVPSLVLAHSSARMALQIEKRRPDCDKGADMASASETCTQWLADSRKKALLAHVGVGTIDQALLAVLPYRHQSLRVFGLSGKVLIVDEVHASDPYVHRILCTLLRFHASQGGSAVLLSATLPSLMRTELQEA